MTGVENSTIAHSFPTSPPPPAKLVCNVNVATEQLQCCIVQQLYCTVPNICRKEGALSSSIVLHSCLPDAYKQRYKIKITHQGTVSLRNQFL